MEKLMFKIVTPEGRELAIIEKDGRFCVKEGNITLFENGEYEIVRSVLLDNDNAKGSSV